MRNFLDKIKILFFFEFFAENVLKTLLRGSETTRKKKSSFREIFKMHGFFSISPARPSINIKKKQGSKKADYQSKIEIEKKLF